MSDLLTLPSLSAAEITALMAGTRDRGGHDRFLAKFAKATEDFNGESRPSLAISCMSDPQYNGKKVSAIEQGLNAAIKRFAQANVNNDDTPTFRLLKQRDDEGEVTDVILFNVEEHAYRSTVEVEATDDTDSE